MEEQAMRGFINILNEELVLATGCTEPAALAFVAATAATRLGGESPERVSVLASGNMIKNAMSAGIPGTPYTGAAYAAAIGAAGGDPGRGLLVFDALRPGAFDAAERLVAGKRVSVGVADVAERLYVDVRVEGKTRSARAVLSGSHTHIVRVEENGTVVFEAPPVSCADDGATGGRALSVKAIYEFAQSLDTGDSGLDIVRQSILVNEAISKEGLDNAYGLQIGRALRARQADGIVCRDMVNEAVCVTTAGADARMAGARIPVISNSGSGNQGITATMPVVAVSSWLKADEDKTLRAVALSHLVAIHVKESFGRLSAFCGAAVAAIGASCGVTYLLGGDEAAVERSIQNMVGNVTGMICDGAKADCALKIFTCVHAAMQAALMAVDGVRVSRMEGINEEDVEKTIANFASLSANCSDVVDASILRMMTSKSA